MTNSTEETATDGRSGIEQAEDGVIIDLTGEDVVIDLRDHASTDEQLRPARPDRPVSGRPFDLAPGLEFVNLLPGDARWNHAERFVYETYREAGYCRESVDLRVEELHAWTDLSTMYVVFDETGDVVGTSRIIKGRFDQLPVGQFTRTDHEDADPLAELSSLAIAPTARGLTVVVHLCRAVFVDAWRSGAHALCFAIDGWMVDLLVDSYCLPVRPLGVRRPYMGGDVSPTALTLKGENFVGTARANPGYWQWMCEGFTPAEVGAWQLPIVLTDDAAESGTARQRAGAERS